MTDAEKDALLVELDNANRNAESYKQMYDKACDDRNRLSNKIMNMYKHISDLQQLAIALVVCSFAIFTTIAFTLSTHMWQSYLDGIACVVYMIWIYSKASDRDYDK